MEVPIYQIFLNLFAKPNLEANFGFYTFEASQLHFVCSPGELEGRESLDSWTRIETSRYIGRYLDNLVWRSFEGGPLKNV